jgi:hypothetical protein
VADVAEALGVTPRTIEHLKKRFVEEGLAAAWACKSPEKPRRPVTFDGPDKEHTMALAGLRFKPGNNSQLVWPWEGISEVTWHHPSPSRFRSFSLRREISFQGRTYRLRDLQDGGASVVWELTLMPQTSHMFQ